MSLQKFSSELEPEARQRLFVRAIAVVAGVCGAAVILQLPFGRGVRAALGLAWLVYVALDFVRLVRSQRHCARIRFVARGEVQVLTADDCCVAATLLPGSVVTRRFAWLRLAAVNGRCYRELVRGNCPQNQDWRRFQVIVRHLGAGP